MKRLAVLRCTRPWLLAGACLFEGQVASGAEEVRLALELSLAREETIESGRVTGTVRLQAPVPAHGRCYYLPYNDPDYERDPARGLSPGVMRYGRAAKEAGRIRIRNPGIEVIKPWLIRVADDAPLAFLARLPRWPGTKGERWFYNDYYPVPLRACPEAEAHPFHYQRFTGMDITARVEYPPMWKVKTPATVQVLQDGPQRRETWRFKGSKLSFTAGRWFKTRSFTVGTTRVEFAWFTASFHHLVPPALEWLEKLQKIYGPLPFPRLLILETEDLEKSLTPGIITINREKQQSKKSDRRSPLNWNLWQLAAFIGNQWYGVSVVPQTIDDYWFQKGMVDYSSWLVLNGTEEAQIFASSPGEQPFFEFEFRQGQDLIAGVLTFLHPYNALTNDELSTRDGIDDQHGFGYIRHALALRYLSWYLGQEKFRKVIHEFTALYLHSRISPRDFYDFLLNRSRHLTAEDRRDAAAYLRDWWTRDEWPDFTLDNVSIGETGEEPGPIRVRVLQKDSMPLPVDVLVELKDGRQLRTRATRHPSGRWFAIFEGQYRREQIHRVEINPEREIFDADRFDNHDGGSKFSFFPGGARTLQDDAYTTLWLPLVAKLPGENFSVMLASQIFRYVQASYTNVISWVPSEKRLGMQFYFLTDIPKWAMFTVFRFVQDFGSSTKGERLVEAGIYRAPFILKDPVTEVGVRLRSRQVLGQKSSVHQTITARLKMDPLNPTVCNYRLNVDAESTPGQTSGGFRYRRDLAIARGNCRIFGLDLGLRLFTGRLEGNGPVPRNVRFKPQNVDEARVRIDAPELASVESLHTVGVDLLLPASLSGGEGMFALNREARWRVFYDYGEAREPDNVYRAAGLGFYIPFGGNAVGKQTISVLQFSVLAVLYRAYDGESSSNPGLLVDFLGKL